MGILDAPALTAAQAAKKYAPSTRSNRVVFMGDSIASLNGNGVSLVGDNWTGYISALSQGRILTDTVRYNTAGYTLSQIRSTHLPTVVALSGNQKPGRAVLLGGTNDVGLGVSFSLSSSMADLTAICDGLVAVGILPVLCTIPPRSDSTTANTNVQTFNSALLRFALTRGYQVLDLHSALVDPITGKYATGLANGDGIHPSPAGMKAAALAVYDALQQALPNWKPWLTNSMLDSANMLSNPVLNTTGGTYTGVVGNAGVAAGWTLPQSTFTPTLVSDGLAPGNWQRVTQNSTTGGNIQFVGTAVPTVGNRYSFACKVRTSGVEAAGTNFSLSINHVNGSNGNVSGATPISAWTRDLGSIIVVYAEVVAAATAVNTRVTLSFGTATSSGASVDIAQPTVRDLTAIGYA